MNMTGKRILICPLDWGLGHATRCIPLIHQLYAEGAEVIIAADKAPLQVLKAAFPNAQYLQFPGLTIEYPKSGNMALYIARMVPALWQMAQQEHQQIEAWVKAFEIDGIISDNRYGAYSLQVPSVFMTHQLFIKGAKFLQWTEPMIRMLNWHMIRKFDACWVPDYADPNNLSGALSHGDTLPLPDTHYLGPLSRFQPAGNTESLAFAEEVLVVLSGPEPQRTMLEDKIRKQLQAGHRKALIIRGKPGASEIPQSGNVRSLSHLDSEALAQALRTAQFIVCRAGYSTLMDLHALGRSALIIPTPGQTEQEYLGQRCHAKGWHISMRQEQFDLESGIEALAKLPTCSFRPYQQTLPFLSPIFPSEKTRKENPKI